MMNRMYSTLVVALFAASAATGVWAAGMDQSGGGAAAGGAAGTSGSNTAQAQFDTLDANHDGTISKKEAKALPSLYKEWKQVDANKDGKVDQAEFAQFEASGGAAGSSESPGGESPSGAGAAPGAPGGGASEAPQNQSPRY